MAPKKNEITLHLEGRGSWITKAETWFIGASYLRADLFKNGDQINIKYIFSLELLAMKNYWQLTLDVVFKRGYNQNNFQYLSKDENYDTSDFKLVKNEVGFTRFLISHYILPLFS